MPIISPIEARRPSGRALYAAMFLVLTLGGLTMIYPFLIMVSGSLRSDMDESDLDLVPSYLVNVDTLYRKFLEFKYNEDTAALNRAHESDAFSFKGAPLPALRSPRAAADLARFLDETHPPKHWRIGGGIASMNNRSLPSGLRHLQHRLEQRFGGDLAAYSRAIGAPTWQWSIIRLMPPHWESKQFSFEPNAMWEEYFKLTDQQPWAQQQLVSLTGFFLESQVYPSYGASSTAAFNADHRRQIRSYGEFALPRTVPDDPKLKREWIDFVHGQLNASFVLLPDVMPDIYRAFLRGRYQDIADLNHAWNARLGGFDEITLPDGRWLSGSERQDYRDFLLTRPPETYRLIGPEFAWHDWLQQQYGTVERVNAAYDAHYPDLAHVPMPVEAMEYAYVRNHARALRWDFASSNYYYVIGELFLQGRGFRNTMTLCALAVLIAVTINPLAAYAMSRFRLRGTYNVLLVLMATVAFPPMVVLIPQFILLRETNLLNTFIALLLPFAANGYLIFLLKTFFDSLPRELYEAASIDGASELRIFWQITMSLSKPILAVVALEAFNAAYTMFLYALIVCPEQDMWLQTVWLSQFQTRATTSAIFASVLIMCIPTLLVFVFAQRIIIRGIVVPTEK